MQNRAHHFIQCIFKFKSLLWAILIVFTLITSLYFLKNFNQADNSLPHWFHHDDPVYSIYENYTREFGPDRFIYLAYEVPDVFTFMTLETLENLTEKLERLPQIEKVRHIMNTEIVRQSDGAIEIRELMPQIPKRIVELGNTRNAILQKAHLFEGLITKNSNIAGVMIEINVAENFHDQKIALKAIKKAIDQTNKYHYPYHLTGAPVTETAFNEYIIRDQRIFMTLTLILILLLVHWSYRNFLLSLTLFSIELLLVMTPLSFLFLGGYKLNIVVGIVCPLLICIGLADALHLIERYTQNINRGIKDPLTQAVAAVFMPCLITTLTTSIGFLSFTNSEIVPLQMMGLLAGCGVLFALLCIFTFLPLTLMKWKNPQASSFQLKGILNQVQKLLGSRSKIFVILSIFLGIGFFSYFGIVQLKTETNFHEYFLPSQTIYKDIQFFKNKLDGSTPLNIVVKPVKEGEEIAINPEIFIKIEKLKNEIESIPSTQRVESHVTIFRQIQEVLNSKDQDLTKNLLAQIHLLTTSGGSDEIERFIPPDRQAIQLRVITKLISSNEMDAYIQKVQGLLKTTFDEKQISTTVTGNATLLASLDKKLFSSQINSLLFASIFITLIMSLFFKNILLGLVSMIPNFFPVYFILGLMGWMHQPLNVTTVLIASVTMGIVVDDTIHFLFHYKKCRQNGLDHFSSIRETLTTVGPAMIKTSIILMIGFLILTLGSFSPTIVFGFMVALTFFVALLCDLILLPCILSFLPSKIFK